MKKSQIIADSLGTGFADDPKWMALVASAKEESVQVVFETMKAPLVAASIVQTSQDALREISLVDVPGELAWHLESSMQTLPDAIGVRLAADGDVLCVNVGTGVLFFKLTDAAKQELKKL